MFSLFHQLVGSSVYLFEWGNVKHWYNFMSALKAMCFCCRCYPACSKVDKPCLGELYCYHAKWIFILVLVPLHTVISSLAQGWGEPLSPPLSGSVLLTHCISVLRHHCKWSSSVVLRRCSLKHPFQVLHWMSQTVFLKRNNNFCKERWVLWNRYFSCSHCASWADSLSAF